MIDSDYVLVHGIIDIGYIYRAIFFIQLDILKVTNGIVGHITEEAIVDKFKPVLRGIKLLAKVVDYFSDVGVGGNFGYLLFAIGKALYNGFVLYLDVCYRVTADVRKTVVVGMVVTTFQKYAVGEFVPDL